MLFEDEWSAEGVECPRPECPSQQPDVQTHVICWQKKTGRYKCKVCGRTFTWKTNTLFANKEHSPEMIVEVLLLLAEGMSIRGVARVKKIKPETAIRWRREAVASLESLEDSLFEEGIELSQVQLDELWTFLKKTRAKEKNKRRRHPQKPNAGSGTH
jgi:transposase-like protein